MSTLLQNKIAVITGAGGGIGRECAKRLAIEGARLILLGGNNVTRLEQTKEIVEKYTSCTVIPGDLSNDKILQDAICNILKNQDAVDILINNAGLSLSSPFESTTIEQFDSIMAINVRVPFILTQKMMPALKKSDTATIINIASVAAHLGYPLQSAYTASKHALLGLTKCIANEYYDENIRVHAICPGGVYTDMVKVARPDLSDEGLIRPEEIADLVYFFLANRGNAVVDMINVHRVNKAPFLV